MENKMPILYSLGCPKCEVLVRKLRDAKIVFELCNNLVRFVELGITEVPMLYADGVLMDFAQAIEWIREHTNDVEE